MFSSRDLTDLAFIAHELARPDNRPILRRKSLSERLLSLFRADFLGQTQWNPETKSFEKPVCYNREDDMSVAYETYYQYRDPISAKIRRRPEATSTYEVITRRELERSEYYNDFLRPFRVSHGLDQYLYCGGQNVGDLRIWRKSAQDEFSVREKTFLRILSPMLIGAYRSMLAGDGLERFVADTEYMAIAFSADRCRHVCSPSLVKWVSEHDAVNEHDLLTTARGAVMSGASTFSTRYYRLEINRRNVSRSSECSTICKVIPVQVQQTERELTAREQDVLRLLAAGMTDREIAEQLGVSFWTVRTHVGNMLQKLGARNRVELAGRRDKPSAASWH